MEISTGNPGLLRQQDIQAPLVAIIADVRIETLKDKRGNEDQEYVVYFAVGKPMKFNVINRKTVVAAYGDERDAWIGKPVEIYVVPNVWMGAKRTGGIRVRNPAATAAASRPAGGARNSAPPASAPTLEQRHAQALAGFAQVQTVARLAEWATWAEGFPFTEAKTASLADAYRGNKARLTPATART
jgi:hypothetical protein